MSTDTQDDNFNSSDKTENIGEKVMSQALLDLAAGPEDISDQKISGKHKEKAIQWHWHLFMVPGLFVLALWVAGAFITGQPYDWIASIVVLVVALLTIPSGRFIRMPSRAGLVGLGLSLGLTLNALYYPEGEFLPGISLALVWAFLSSLVCFWLWVAVWRQLGRRKLTVTLVVTAILIYALSSPVLAFINWLTLPGQEQFSFEALIHSPLAITDTLPWFLWPQSFLFFLVPFLVFIFLIKDQWDLIRGYSFGSFHLGNLYLALGSLVLIFFGFLVFTPISEVCGDVSGSLRHFMPEAENWYKDHKVVLLATATPEVSSNNETSPAVAEPKVSPEVSKSDISGEDQDLKIKSVDDPEAVNNLATAETEAVADSLDKTENESQEVSVSGGGQGTVLSVSDVPINSLVNEDAENLTNQSVIPSETTKEPLDVSLAGEVLLNVPEHLVESGSKELLVTAIPAEAQPIPEQSATVDAEIGSLKSENENLKWRINNLEEQIIFLKGRLAYEDEVILNLTRYRRVAPGSYSENP